MRKLTVIAPSTMKSHLQAERPFAPLSPLVIPAAMRPEKAPESNDPEYKTAVRLTSSFLVYQAER